MAKKTFLDTVRETFNFNVEKRLLSANAADGERITTPFYGLFSSADNALCSDRAVTKRYKPHTTDDIVALCEAAAAALGGIADGRCWFDKGHYVEVQPTKQERAEIYKSADPIFPRFIIRAGYDGKSFQAIIGLFRDACANLQIMRQVEGTVVTIRHTNSLREKMDDLIEQFHTLNGGWGNLVQAVRGMESRRVQISDFIRQIYPLADGAQGRAVTTWEQRMEKIMRRIDREREATGRPRLDFTNIAAEVSMWEAYNAVQGFVQHDATRQTENLFGRAIKSNDNKEVKAALSLALAV